MNLQVAGKHVNVGEALRDRISRELEGSIGKYFERGGDAEVVVSREGHAFRVDCVVGLASGQGLQSHGLGGDAHAAFDTALAKIESRLRRYKGRLKSHTPQAAAKAAETAQRYVLRAPSDEAADLWEEESWQGEGGPSVPSALVVAESTAVLKTMTVSMAVLALDLTEAQTIVFRNAAHGGLSVVYRRPDGNIGWIDPERAPPNEGGARKSGFREGGAKTG